MLFVVVVFLCLFVGLLSNLVFITRLHVNLVYSNNMTGMHNGFFCNQIEIWCKICMPFFPAMQKFQDRENDDDYYTGK